MAATVGSIVKPLAADLAYITAEDKKTIEAEISDTRSVLDAFYGKASAVDISKLLEQQNARDDSARRQAYLAEDLTQLSNKEVIDLLRHRDDAMKLNASMQLEKRMKRLNGPELEKFKAYLIDNGLREIVDTLICANYKLQETSLNLIKDLATPEVIDVKIRATGGLENIARLVVSPNREIKTTAMFLMVNLSHGDNNRDAFRRMTGVIESIVPGLDSADEYFQRTTLKILVNLAVAPKLQDPIAQAGAMFKALQMMKMVKADRSILIECLKLLQNISACTTVKTTVSKDTMLDVFPYLQPKTLYLTPSNDETVIQLAALTFFSNISAFEPNQKVLAELSLLRTLFLYFMPLGKQANVKWNHQIIICVMECINALLNHLSNRLLFLDSGGPRLLLAFIDRVMAEFPQPELYLHDAITVLDSLLKGTGASMIRLHQDPELITSIVASVCKVLDTYQNGASYVVEICVRVLRSIATAEESRVIIAQYADMRLLAGILEKHNIKEVIQVVSELFARIAGAPDARRALFSIAPFLASVLVNNDESLRFSVIQALREVARDSAGAQLLLNSPGAVLNIVDLLDIQNVDMQQLAMITIADMIHQSPQAKREEIKHDMMQAGVLGPLIKLLMSKADSIQLIAIALCTSMASNDVVREALVQMGIHRMLEEVERTPAFTKPNSNLVGPMKNLRTQLLDRDVTGMGIAMKKAQEQSDDPDAVLETLLSKLTVPQLVRLVKEAVGQGADLIPLITKMMQTNMAISKARVLNPKMAIEEDAKIAATAAAAASSVPRPPPPASKSAGFLSGAAKKGGKRPKFGGGDTASAKTGILDVIKSFKDKPYQLKKVDTDAETQRRRAAAQQKSSMLKSIQNAYEKKEVRLLDSGAAQGKRYFAKDIALYIEEAGKVFLVDPNLLKIIFDLVESQEATYEYQDAFNKLSKKTVSQEQFTDALWKLGFTVRYRREVQADTEEKLATTPPITIYTQIITPSDLPVKQLLRIIQLTAKKAKKN